MSDSCLVSVKAGKARLLLFQVAAVTVPRSVKSVQSAVTNAVVNPEVSISPLKPEARARSLRRRQTYFGNQAFVAGVMPQTAHERVDQKAQQPGIMILPRDL